MAFGAAHGKCAAVYVQHPAGRIGTGRQHPLGGNPIHVYRGNGGGDFQAVGDAVHVFPHQRQALPIRRALNTAGIDLQGRHHRIVLIAGRIATGETLSGGGIELAEAGATQMQESNGNQNQGN